MTVVTRFAPSPTGSLHIGGARTALFNWLYARHHGGRFLLRIEDTDRERSTQAAIDAILDGLTWLELGWDGEPLLQSTRAPRHAAVALGLLASDRAYPCYCSPQELEEMRARALKEGRSSRYDGRWRDRDPQDAPPGVKPVVRLRMPQTGDTVIVDRVQGEVRVANEQLDDFVLLRADGTPTYMLSVVVDDFDMGVTHVIRGDDHLTNAFRQKNLIEACGFPVPVYAHLPLIHGADGAKLSKRHGAVNVSAYRELGYLPAAMRNYLMRLGWSHGDAEVISTEQAIAWFELDHIGHSAARFDLAKLDHLNGVYIRATAEEELLRQVAPLIESKQGHGLDAPARARILRGMPGLKPRAKTLVELAEKAAFYAVAPTQITVGGAWQPALATATGTALQAIPDNQWSTNTIEHSIRQVAGDQNIKLGDLAKPLRIILTGSTVSPPLFEVMEALGKEETLARLA
ncbi:MAG: glutamate--tRNA ligase [Alphaproteobacteria bacterium]|nr:glutamate--tRNA ligase [Alphaproteobacteria bacterium]